VGDEGVLLGEFLLLLLLVVEGALVLLGVAVLPAERVVALAVEPEEAHFLLALPAQSLVCLLKKIELI